MLIKSIQLKDFRQFKGNHEQINFSTDEEKNVTVIIGENGTGKTTLAQAFSWCLYEETNFTDKKIINRSTAQEMKNGSECEVIVVISLIHSEIEYTFKRVQKYFKTGTGAVKGTASLLSIMMKKEGQQKQLSQDESVKTLREILPQELAGFFFFDGEKIENMSKEINKGKSKEFQSAVESLLGLNVLKEALDHLKGYPNTGNKFSVMRSYNESYNSEANSKYQELNSKINGLQFESDKNIKYSGQLEKDEELFSEKRDELLEIVRSNEKSQELAKRRDSFLKDIENKKNQKSGQAKVLLKKFNENDIHYFAQPLIGRVLDILKETGKIDVGIPDIHHRTIDFLVKRGYCLCHSPIAQGSEAHQHLLELKDYIPPQSIGTLIEQFTKESDKYITAGKSFFENMGNDFQTIDSIENEINGYQDDINNIENELQRFSDIRDTELRYKKYREEVERVKVERLSLSEVKGRLEKDIENANKELQQLALQDATNRKIEVYKTYVEYLFETLKKLYKQQENEMRQKLSKTVNEIFKKIYNGGLSLEISENYGITIKVNGYQNNEEDEVDASTAQSISVIIAFIASVIKINRDSKSRQGSGENNKDVVVSEPYPLIMDAPLSAFDKKRIKTICDTLPTIAEQVVIFIKDTDGDIAERHLKEKIGKRYLFAKKNEFESQIKQR